MYDFCYVVLRELYLGFAVLMRFWVDFRYAYTAKFVCL